jgi:hypothetical protein
MPHGLGEVRIIDVAEILPDRVHPRPTGLVFAGQQMKMRRVRFCVGIVRIDRLDVLEDREGFIDPQHLGERLGLAVERGKEIRP